MHLHRYYLLAVWCDPLPPFCWEVEPPTNFSKRRGDLTEF